MAAIDTFRDARRAIGIPVALIAIAAAVMFVAIPRPYRISETVVRDSLFRSAVQSVLARDGATIAEIDAMQANIDAATPRNAAPPESEAKRIYVAMLDLYRTRLDGDLKKDRLDGARLRAEIASLPKP